MPKPIQMKRSDFFQEHKGLIKLLNVGRELLKEAKKQQSELNKYKLNPKRKRRSEEVRRRATTKIKIIFIIKFLF